MRPLVVIITPKRGVVLLTAAATVFLSIGIGILIASYGVEYCEVGYSVERNQSGILEFSSANCPHLPDLLRGKHALYYKLDGYYQNHKEFRRSIDYDQLYGKVIDKESRLSSCRPYVKDRAGRIRHPCGTLARRVFTDRFTVFRDVGKTKEVELDESREAICNKYGVHTLFKNPSKEEMEKYRSTVNFWMADEEYQTSLNMNKPGVGHGVENSHFINWVDVATTSTVKKLYGILDVKELPLPFYVNVQVFRKIPDVVKKSVVIEKQQTLGRMGRTLGMIYVIVALFLALFAIMAFAHLRVAPQVG